MSVTPFGGEHVPSNEVFKRWRVIVAITVRSRVVEPITLISLLLVVVLGGRADNRELEKVTILESLATGG